MSSQSIARQIGNIFTLCATRAFNSNLPIGIKAVHDRKVSHHYQTDFAPRLYRWHQQQQFSRIEQDITPKMLAEEVLDLLQLSSRPELVAEVDEFGNINMTLTDRLLEEYTNQVASSGQFRLPQLKAMATHGIQSPVGSRIVVLLPILDMIAPTTLKDYRQWTNLQWIARTNQHLLGNTVERRQIVMDNTDFIGIVLGMISQQRQGKQLSMADIAKFLSEKSLTTEEAIRSYSQQILNQLNSNGSLQIIYKDMKELFTKHRSRMFDGLVSNQEFELSSSLQQRGVTALQYQILTSLGKDRTCYFSSSNIKNPDPNHIQMPVGDIDSHQSSAVSFLNQLSKGFSQRLKQSIPGSQLQLDQGMVTRSLRYYLSRIPTTQRVMIENTEPITSLWLTRAEQLSDLTRKLEGASKQPTRPFTIDSRADRQFARLVCSIGDCLQSYDFATAHTHLDRMHHLLKASNHDRCRLRVIWAITSSFRHILGLD